MCDLLCHSPSLEQHLRDVREVLSILRQEKLYVKASKRDFGRAELGFLGHRVSAAGVAVCTRKGRGPCGIGLFRHPTSSYYYRRFVDGYADIAAPLTWLCGPHAPGTGAPPNRGALTRGSST